MSNDTSTPSPGDRRGFLIGGAAAVLGAAAYAVPALAALAAFLNPWRQKGEAGRLVRVTTLPALTLNGPPQRFPIIAQRTDAWNRFDNEPIGAVFLRRTGETDVEAIQVVCPHAGCSVTYDQAAGGFFCPCHTAHFDIAGRRTDQQSPSPRDLDTLKVVIQNGDEVWIQFEEFYTGRADKVLKS
jgi:menaquinol-cytochrome c reductase iron-sulfur subunit